MSEYKITKVSQEKPNEWKGPNGTVYYIKVMLEGHDRPVSIGKKSPDALKAGDTVYGTIIEEPGYEVDKWKAEQPPKSGGYQKSAQDKEDIARAVALKAAVEYAVTKDLDVLSVAESYLSWLKGETPDTEPENVSESKDTVITDNIDDPINLDDIPF